MIIGIGAALLAVALGLITYGLFYKGSRKTTYTADAKSRHQDTNITALPGFIDRTLRNITGWKVTHLIEGQQESALDRAMAQSGNPWRITKRQYYALVILSSIAYGIGGAVLLFIIGGAIAVGLDASVLVPFLPIIGFLGGAALGYTFPLSMMRSKANKKQNEIISHLDEAMDLFSIATSVDMSISEAMATTRRYLLEGDLQEEISQVVDDVNSNMSFADALDGLQERVPNKRITTFVRTLKSANLDGTDRTETLRREAAEIRQDQQRLMEKRSGLVQMIFIVAIVVGLLPLIILPFAVPFISAFLAGNGFL